MEKKYEFTFNSKTKEIVADKSFNRIFLEVVYDMTLYEWEQHKALIDSRFEFYKGKFPNNDEHNLKLDRAEFKLLDVTSYPLK